MLLGDYVGYGADPEWTVTTVMELVDKGAMAVLGNHDSAVSNPREQLNFEAKIAIEWTRGELERQRRFPRELPLTLKTTTASTSIRKPAIPRSWRYVTSTLRLPRSIIATSAQITFCGHVHRPALYSMSATGKDDGVQADHRRARPIACRAGAGSPCSARSGSRATAIRPPPIAMLDTTSAN